MNRNQKKFEEIKKVLIDRLGDEVEYSKDEDGTESLALKNSEFWISTTFGELVVATVYIIRISAKNSEI